MASVTYPRVLAFKPETIITNMPRASKSTGAREPGAGAPLLKKITVVGQKKKKKKKTRRILERKSSEKENRGLRMLIKKFCSLIWPNPIRSCQELCPLDPRQGLGL